jgi:[ribosomal protein S18]-alanine N-acetyltransferase
LGKSSLAHTTRERTHTEYNGDVHLAIQDFQIRDFKPADFDALWSIDQDCFPPGISYSRAELKTYMRRRGSFTLVAVNASADATADPDLQDGKKLMPPTHQTKAMIAGFIVAEAARGAGHIITIDVIAPARRVGAGSLLLRGAEDRLRAAGCRSVALETAVDNISALSFYKRHGYSVTATFPRYYSNGVDALVLQKDLASA